MKSWKPFLLPLLFAVLLLPSVARSSVNERLNKLFYWKVADSLELSAKEEKTFVLIVESLQNERRQLLKKQEELFSRFSEVHKKNDEVEAQKLLDAFWKVHEDLDRVDMKERAELKAVVGSVKLLQYYKLRDEIFARVQKALRRSTQPVAQ